jgi:hypothetical protein
VEVRLRRLLRQAAARADRQRRAPGALTRSFKLVYFVPEDARDSTRDAVFAAGGGVIGGYEHCSWYTAGTGTFHGGEGTAPAVGEAGRDEHVAEYRVEILVPGERLEASVAALRAAHPYEEPAIDVYPLHDAP